MSEPDDNIEEKDKVHELQNISDRFLESLKNIKQTITIVMPHFASWKLNEIKKEEKKYESLLATGEKSGSKIKFQKAKDFADFKSSVRRISQLQHDRSMDVLARSLVIQMFCELDAFMGALLRQLYSEKSDLLNAISRGIPISELIVFDSINAAKASIIDKEIDGFRRESYIEQFSQLEKNSICS